MHAAEESRGGAKDMLETGALDGIDGIAGIHVWPDTPSGTITTKASSTQCIPLHSIPFCIVISMRSAWATAHSPDSYSDFKIMTPSQMQEHKSHMNLHCLHMAKPELWRKVRVNCNMKML